MNVVDLAVLLIVALAALQGARRGLTGQVLSLAGFAAGAFAGSRIAPHLLEDGARSGWVPIASLAGAVIGAFLVQVVAALAAGTLRGFFLRGPLRLADSACGLALGTALGLGLVWLGGVVALHQPDLGLRSAVPRSAIVPALVEALPPDRLLRALQRFDPLPRIALPELNLPPPDRSVLASPAAREAAASVVKLRGSSCGLGVQGTGWVIARGVVATNAHVVAGQRETSVLAPNGQRLKGRLVYLDVRNDVALMRVRSLRAQALPTASRASTRGPVVLLGYPNDGRLVAAPGSAGTARRVVASDAYGRKPRPRRVVPLRGAIRPGDSGGPVVDAGGRVIAMMFAAAEGNRAGLGVPVALVVRGLDRPLEPVPPGPCAR